VINHIERRVFEVSARFSLSGPAEFIGVHRHLNRQPSAILRVCGIDLEFSTPQQSSAFAAAAAELSAEHKRAVSRAEIAREPHAEVES
jgi:hypothetical protein